MIYLSYHALCGRTDGQIARPILFGLAAEGEVGVKKVLQMLRDEFELTMTLSGCRSLKDISRNHVVTNGGEGGSNLTKSRL